MLGLVIILYMKNQKWIISPKKIASKTTFKTERMHLNEPKTGRVYVIHWKVIIVDVCNLFVMDSNFSDDHLLPE